jgi:hypothetical protein
MLKLETLFYVILLVLTALSYSVFWYLDTHTEISTWLLLMVFIVLTCTVGVSIFHAMLMMLANHMVPNIEARDIDELLLSYKELYTGVSQMRQWIAGTIAACPQGIVTLSPDLSIEEVNQGALEILGTHIIGNSIVKAIPDHTMYNALQSALANLEVTNSTALINGTYYSVLIKVHTWEEKVKSVVLMIFRPSANNTVFSGYDSDIVHDIRTPVTAILNATEILKQDGSDPQVLQKFLPLIDEQSKRLYHIAKNIKARQECH